MRDLISGPWVAGSMPRTRSVPPLTGDIHEIIRMVEVLPAPFGPRNPNDSPRPISKSTESTATKSPKRFWSPRAHTIGLGGAATVALLGSGAGAAARVGPTRAGAAASAVVEEAAAGATCGPDGEDEDPGAKVTAGLRYPRPLTAPPGPDGLPTGDWRSSGVGPACRPVTAAGTRIAPRTAHHARHELFARRKRP
jgi:hypothetical protein